MRGALPPGRADATVEVMGRLGHIGRTGWLVVAFVVVFLTVGLPRFLNGDDASPTSSDPAAAFTKICREHGGTPRTPASGTNAPAQQVCTVRYGDRVYRMDAITPRGFDRDTAKFQRQGCEQAARQAGDASQRFVYHPTTGVCERRP